MVAMSLLQLSRAQACAHRIKEVLETEPSVENKPEGEICRAALPGEAADGTDHVLPAPRGEVEFRDVSFKYVASGSGDDVLSHISFHVRPGQFVAIVGGTGTGKSTLVNLIPRFYDVTGGQVLLDGVDVRNYPWRSSGAASAWCSRPTSSFPAPSGRICCGATRRPQRRR